MPRNPIERLGGRTRTATVFLFVIAATTVGCQEERVWELEVRQHVTAPTLLTLGLLHYDFDVVANVYETAFGFDNMRGEGATALTWLLGDVDGVGNVELIQLWSNDGRLALIVWEWTGSRWLRKWKSGDVGHGSAAESWLGVDIESDGLLEIIQPFANGSRLGLIVHEWDGTQYTERWSEGDMNTGWGAEAWLSGDVEGDGMMEIIQPWANGSRLATIVYGWDGSQYSIKSNVPNMDQGWGAEAWLTADVDGNGTTEIVQPWANGPRLAMLVWGWDATVAEYVEIGNDGDMQQGWGAEAWLVADVDGNGTDEIVQPWANGSSLGMIVWEWDAAAAAYVEKWSNPDMQQGWDAEAWLVADVDGNGTDEIVQPWANGDALAMIIYEWDGAEYTTRSSVPDMGQGWGAVAWLAGDLEVDGPVEIIQPWEANQADRIMADATRRLKVADDATDFACNVRFTRYGQVTPFTEPTGIINSEDDWIDVDAVSGQVKVVKQINWCSMILPGTQGCTDVNSSLIVTRRERSFEGGLWAHEFGHSSGLASVPPHPADPTLIMAVSPGNNVTEDDCEAYRSP